jgi:ribose 5-phosphate isomerase B
MKIAFCSDHRGYNLKIELIKKVQDELGYECLDFGCDNDTRCDFPIYAFKAAESVAKKESDYGIVICGSGDGVCVAANKVKGIRCTLAINASDATRAKGDIDANVLALGAEKTNVDEAFEIVKSLVETTFVGERHTVSIDMISEHESNN